jgi:hypothetical protein
MSAGSTLIPTGTTSTLFTLNAGDTRFPTSPYFIFSIGINPTMNQVQVRDINGVAPTLTTPMFFTITIRTDLLRFDINIGVFQGTISGLNIPLSLPLIGSGIGGSRRSNSASLAEAVDTGSALGWYIDGVRRFIGPNGSTDASSRDLSCFPFFGGNELPLNSAITVTLVTNNNTTVRLMNDTPVMNPLCWLNFG